MAAPHVPLPFRHRRRPRGAPPSAASLARFARLEEAYGEAARDPEYQREMAELARDWSVADLDGLREET